MLRELLEAQRRYPSLFATLVYPKALFKLDGTLVAANDAALAFLSTTGERGIGEVVDRLPHCERHEVREAFRNASAGTTVEFSTSLPRPGGLEMLARATLAPALVGNVIVGVYATGRDVTRERDASRDSERKVRELTSLFERNSDAMIVVDALGRFRGINPAGERLTGYAAEELAGQPYDTIFAAESIEDTRGIFARALAGETVSAQAVVRTRDGAHVEIAGMVIPIVVDEIVIGVYAVGRIPTEERGDETDARVQADRVRELYLVAASSERTAESQIRAALTLGTERLQCTGAYVTRIEDDTVTFLYGVGEVGHASNLSWPLDQSLHRHIVAAGRPFSIDDVAAEPHEIAATTLSRAARAFIGTPLVVGGRAFGTICFVNGDARGVPFTDADRDYVRLIGTLASSAIDRGDQRQRLNTLAFFDALTGLPNRVLLSDRLMQAIAAAQRDGSIFAVHFYDLDGFKHINDAHGHLRGDDVLRLIARRFERVARDIDTVARVGGDEFVIVQPGVRDIDDALVLSGRLREAVAEPFILNGRERRLSASGGIALYPQDGEDAATLIARADAALYRVKGRGRNDVAAVTTSDAAIVR